MSGSRNTVGLVRWGNLATHIHELDDGVGLRLHTQCGVERGAQCLNGGHGSGDEGGWNSAFSSFIRSRLIQAAVERIVNQVYVSGEEQTIDRMIRWAFAALLFAHTNP